MIWWSANDRHRRESSRWSSSSEFYLFLLVHLVGYAPSQTLKCGWPGKPVGGMILTDSSAVPPIGQPPNGFVPTSRLLVYEHQYEEGHIVSYRCQSDRLDVIKGAYVNRTCQSDGRWSGTRPYCDLNVAYGKSVTYSGASGADTSTKAMTDGLTDSRDLNNAAECPSMGNKNAYLSLDLGQRYPVRTVTIYGKADGTLTNVMGKKVTLDYGLSSMITSCQETMANRSLNAYQCQREWATYVPDSAQSVNVRFDHASAFAVPICEIVVYANPTLADCGEPEIPANGEAAITTASSYQEAKYTCHYGYDLVGNDVRTCYGRSWSGDQPVCVEQPVTTTEFHNSTGIEVDGGDHGGLATFQIVLIVVCVSLGLGLVVALIVLLRFGRLQCCKGSGGAIKRRLSGSTKKTPPQDYEQVKTTETGQEQSNNTSKKAAAEEVRRMEEEAFVNTQLAFQDEKPLAKSDQPEKPKRQRSTVDETYAELYHEPRRPGSPPESPLATDHTSPIYAQINTKAKSNAAVNDDSSVASDNVFTGEEAAIAEEGQTAPAPSRKSYIPLIYLKESPEVQMKHQALNNQLKDAVKINRVTDF